MARACVARRVVNSSLISTALLIARVPAQPIDAACTEDITETTVAASSEETVSKSAEETTETAAEAIEDSMMDISAPAAEPVNELPAFRKIAEVASVIPVLQKASTAAAHKASVFESGPLTEASMKAAEAGQASEELESAAKQWVALRLPEAPLKDMDEVIALYRDQFLVSENQVSVNQAYANQVNILIDELSSLKNAKALVDFLHAVDSAFQVVTMDAIEEKKMRAQRFLQFFMNQAPQH